MNLFIILKSFSIEIMNFSIESKQLRLQKFNYHVDFIKIDESTNVSYVLRPNKDVVVAGNVSQYLSVALVIINMVVIGGLLNGDEIIHLLRRPSSLGLSLLCRYAIMPAIGLGMVEMFYPGSHCALGVLGFILSPSEGHSCLLSLSAGGDVTLSVLITCVNNFASGAMLSLWAIIYEKRIYNEAGRIKIPFKEIYIIFSYLMLAPAIGFLTKIHCQKVYKNLYRLQPLLITLGILMQLFVEVFKGYAALTLVTGQVFLMSTLIVICGLAFGTVVPLITKHSTERVVVMSLDCGVRSALVSHALLSSGDLTSASVIPVLLSLISLLSSSIAVLSLKLYRTYQKKKDVSVLPEFAVV